MAETADVTKVNMYRHRDVGYDTLLQRQSERQIEVEREKRLEQDRLLQIRDLRISGAQGAIQVFGQGYAGYGNGWTDVKPRILYPKERKRPRRHLKEIRISRDAANFQASQSQILVPVRLDIDSDKFKIRDTFTWDLNDRTIPLEVFAEHLCEDFSLPIQVFAPQIQRSLKEQLADFHPHQPPGLAPNIGTYTSTTGNDENYNTDKDDDLRIRIKLDITIGTYNLIDQFDWDLNNVRSDPEQFSAQLCLEMGLSGEFNTAIAHAIREQCQLYTKSLFLVGYTFDGKALEDNDMRHMILPRLQQPVRPGSIDDFTPLLYDLTSDEMDRQEKDRDRETRRNRRQTRAKRGVNLPDLRDLPKTHRTPVLNSVLVPQDDRWMEKYGIMRPPLPGTNEAEEEDLDRDDEEAEEGSTPPAHIGFTERTTRSSRALRSLPVQNSTSAHNQIPLQQSNAPSRQQPVRQHIQQTFTSPRELSPLNNAQRQQPEVPRQTLHTPQKMPQDKSQAPKWSQQLDSHAHNYLKTEPFSPLSSQSQHREPNHLSQIHVPNRPDQAESGLNRTPSLLVTLKVPKLKEWTIRRGLQKQKDNPNTFMAPLPVQSSSFPNPQQQQQQQQQLQQLQQQQDRNHDNASSTVRQRQIPSLQQEQQQQTQQSQAVWQASQLQEAQRRQQMTQQQHQQMLQQRHIQQQQLQQQMLFQQQQQTQPAAPIFLQHHLTQLRQQFPLDKFDGVVRPNPQNSADLIVRIRCVDCPGKLYFPDDFDVHLKNRQHRDRVQARVGYR